MPVATHPQPPVDESVRAGIGGRLLEERHRLCRLEGGAGRVSALYGPVEQRFLFVLLQQGVVSAPLSSDELVRVEGGRRHHAENLARLGFDGHDAPDFVLHQPFAQHLQVDVDAQFQVLPGHGRAVEPSVHVMPLYASVGIAQQDFHALLAAQVLFVAFLDALLADVVAAAIVVVFLNVSARHLPDVSQGMSGGVVGILPYGSPLYAESGEFEEFFLEDAAFLGRELCHEHLLRIARVAGILAPVLHVGHEPVELFAGDVQRAAEVGRVKVAHFARHEGDVVGRLVEHQQLAVAVVDGAARRILHLVEEGVVVGILLIFVRQQLQVYQANQIDEHNEGSRPSNHELPFFEFIILSHASNQSELVYRVNGSASVRGHFPGLHSPLPCQGLRCVRMPSSASMQHKVSSAPDTMRSSSARGCAVEKNSMHSSTP